MVAENPTPAFSGLDFLWLELTNRCNLACVHCYSNSGPHSLPGKLTTEEYRRIIDDAAEAGCRKIQFIGGEPTIHKQLVCFLRQAQELRYEFVEVYTNGVWHQDNLLRSFAEHNVHVAVSFYSHEARVHDEITTSPGSWQRTLRTIRELLARQIPLRASVIVMPKNAQQVSETVEFLYDLGVPDVRVDHVRGVGRGEYITIETDKREALCGRCWKNSLAISADGDAFPCIFARHLPLGKLPEQDLVNLCTSENVVKVCEELYEFFRARTETDANRSIGTCSPDLGPPSPCLPTCTPHTSPQPCNPYSVCSPIACNPTACTPCSPGCGP